MIRQNRAVPILMVLTLAWLLYLGGCFGGEEATTAVEEPDETVISPTATPPPVVTQAVESDGPKESPLWHTIVEGDRLPAIAATYSVSQAVILRANPGLDADFLVIGERLLIPGASIENNVEEDLATAREAGRSIDHAVLEGENLGSIARDWLVSIDAILEANPGIDANNLQISQLLVIPPRGTGLTDEEMAALLPSQPVARDPFETYYHTVQPGDSLSSLAEIFSVTVDDIIAANGLANPDAVAVGDELAIPPPTPDAETDG